MAYNALNNLIDAYIYPNGVQAITGSILNNVLKSMVSQLGGGYNLMGVAAPASSPAVNDEPLAYFAATAGTYTNFDGIVLAAGEVAVLLTSGNGSWSKQTIYNVPTGTSDLVNTAGFITNAVDSLVNFYAKSEIDAQKAETDAALGNRYTKTETDAKLADYYKKTETYDKDEVDSIIAALNRQSYVVAWDGTSAPVVSAIPAGVTVTYSGTTYTGTLAASASTVNKIYMVWNGSAYDMYGTSHDGVYSWINMGTTAINLQQYATKEDLLNTHIEYDSDSFSITGFINADGSFNPNPPSGYVVTDYIPINKEDLVSLQICALLSNQYGGGLAFYDEGKNYISNIINVFTPASSVDDKQYTVSLGDIPATAKYIRVCSYESASNVPFVKITYGNNVLKALVKMQPLSQYTDVLKDIAENGSGLFYNLDANDFIIDNTFIEPSGNEISNSYLYTTDFLPIVGFISLNVVALMRNTYGGGIAFYDANKGFISSIYNVSQPATDNNVPYQLSESNIPVGAKYIKVQGRKVTSPSITPPSVTLKTDGEGLLDSIIEKPANQNALYARVASLGSSGSVSIAKTPQTRNGYIIGVAMGISEMGKVRIDKGDVEWRAGIIEIDQTNLYVYNPISPSSTPTQYPHGLTIADFLNVQIELPLNAARIGSAHYAGKVRIITNSTQSFEQEIPWMGCSGNVKLTAISGSYTDVELMMNGLAFTKEIWLFGDSYVDFWCPYASAIGAYNFMIDGKSGRQADEAYQSLVNALEVGKPKAVVWAMGMNNGDSGSVNTSWLDVFNKVKALCEKKGIQFIPCTIPNTPTVVNYYKNEVIKNSGLFYVDIAKAVGADQISASWYSGLLSQDNTHPTEKGSIVIANYVASMLPLMFGQDLLS